jgi:hypothetical protein
VALVSLRLGRAYGLDGLLKESACGPRQKGLLLDGTAPVRESIFGHRLLVRAVGCHAVEMPVRVTTPGLHEALRAIASRELEGGDGGGDGGSGEGGDGGGDGHEHGGEGGGTRRRSRVVQSLMLDYFDKIHADDSAVPYWPVRRHLRFSPTIVAEADAFVARALGKDGEDGEEGERKRYLSLHFRRTDFVRGHGEIMSSVAQVAGMLREQAARAGVAHVIVATDTNADELAELRAALLAAGAGGQPPLTLHRYAPPSSASGGEGGADDDYASLIDWSTKTSRLQLAKIDQALAAAGAVFVGTARSHFSKEIHLERRLLLGDAAAWYRTSSALVGGGKIIPMCGDPDRPTADGPDDCEGLPGHAGFLGVLAKPAHDGAEL